MGADERHYNINNLNRWFAFAAVVLLCAVIFLFFSDYSRNWKNYQNDYQNTEITNTRVKLDDEATRLKNDPEYQKLLADLKVAKDEYAKQCSPAKLKSANDQIEKLTAHSEILKQKYRVIKGQLDAAKFQYEEIAAKGDGDVKVAQIRYKSLEQQIKQLNQNIEKTDTDLTVSKKMVDECGQSLREVEKKQRAAEKKIVILQRKLKKIDPNEMNLLNRFANLFRNAPVIDLASPTFKIQQVVLKDIRDDVNFMTVPKVDRCTTCHLGIANPDYKDAAQPLRTHPNLELFMAKDSNHPLEDFGCTVCHNGRGRGTDFISAAHTPSSPEQAKEWEKKYGWHELIWDKPMYPTQYVQASCIKCHYGQTTIKGAEKLNLGLNLVERAGCYACHNIDKYKDWPKPGPDLTHLATKTSKEWSYRWLRDPTAFRHNTWMPSFFGQSNNSDPESKARGDQEVHAIISYLFTESDEYKMTSMPKIGDAKKGEELVASVGCFGCHNLDTSKTKVVRDRDALHREQGPNLIGFGTKTSKVWLYQWLKDPQRYHPGTRMPNLRLTDDEAADIAAFLSQNENSEFAKQAIPSVDENILDVIVGDFLRKSITQSEAQAKVAKMTKDEKLHFAGQKLIAQYGCYSCHDIKGFNGYKPIGTDLNEEGSKAPEKLDFGFVDIEHTKEAWFKQKFQNPRIYDYKKIKTADEKLRMPNYHFTEAEAEAITTAILGFVKEKPGKIKPRTAENLAMEKGERIIREYNCQGCHIIQGDGGAIRKHVTDWLVKYQDKEPNDAEAVTTTFSPPNLVGEGKKVQTQWLFEFIHKPVTIRPWLHVRMPTYAFNANELNSILKYFTTIDKEEFPFTEHVNTDLNPTELAAAQKLFSPDYFDCAKCHIIGSKMPGGSADSWAPDFSLANQRLKPEWVIDWIKNPAALLPGTKMPTFFDPHNFSEAGPPDILNGDENEQIRVLRNYIMSISTLPPPPAPAPMKKDVEPAAAASTPAPQK